MRSLDVICFMMWYSCEYKTLLQKASWQKLNLAKHLDLATKLQEIWAGEEHVKWPHRIQLKKSRLWEDPFFKDFIYFIFRKRGRTGEREGEKHPVDAPYSPPTRDLAQACVLTWNQTSIFQFSGWCSVHWATPVRVRLWEIIQISSIHFISKWERDYLLNIWSLFVSWFKQTYCKKTFFETVGKN